jgi:hypothetical protein
MILLVLQLVFNARYNSTVQYATMDVWSKDAKDIDDDGFQEIIVLSSTRAMTI